jgi:tyrosyl-tRNA synthetase
MVKKAETGFGTTEKLFANQTAPAESLSEEDLESMEGVVKIDYVLPGNGVDITSFLAETNIFPSKGEARKMVQNGGVSINRKKVAALDFTVASELLLHNKYLLVQKGKKELLFGESQPIVASVYVNL